MKQTAARDTPLEHSDGRSPRVSDRARAADRLAELAEALSGPLASRRARRRAAALADHSPHLWHLAVRDPELFLQAVDADPGPYLDALLDDLRRSSDANEADLMARLRRVKRSTALVLALADLGGAWPLERVLEALSRTADVLVAVALAHLLRRAQAAGRLKVDLADPERGCGLVVLGLGKLGGNELNYSSDVDLMVLFDPRSPALATCDNVKTFAVRLVRDLVRILQQPTADGYVLRVDLRLRPEPEASAVALSTDAALLYYEQFGQTWERAALIKARPVAGDRDLGATFLSELSPFIWRRYLDFAAIADIRAMKRRIHAAKGWDEIAVLGHNVKLGRGGIRDIEFFVQAQQLIYGGRQEDLRGSQTLPMLRRLRHRGLVSRSACDDLGRAYLFLRRIENRLQMIGDAQTHVMPVDPAALERFARFCGYRTVGRFSGVFRRHLERVAFHYKLLFEGADDGAVSGSGIDLGRDVSDPDMLRRLAELGFRQPATVAAALHEWQAGLRPALRSARARDLLGELTPKLLVTLSRTADPDAAFRGFDRSLERMSAAGELFAILAANAALRALYGEILGSAPPLALAVTTHPHLLDIAIDPASSVCCDEIEMGARIAAAIAHLSETEDVLDALRDYQHAEHFLIGVRLLSGRLTPDGAAHAYTALAVGVLRALLPHVRARLEAEHGELPGSALALLAMGKLGSGEMTATSDLDLVLVYDFDPDAAETTGRRPIPASTFFTRLTQRLVSALSQPTRRGRVYDVDMRLRPSGRQGPLATRFSAFAAYQRESAQTWEHMALTRARVVAGDDPGFGSRVAAEIEAVLRSASRTRLREDIADMRALMRREKPPQGDWDLKLSPGGLVDIEFIAQYLALRDAATRPDSIVTSTRCILEDAAAAGAVATAFRLAEAHRLLSQASQMMRLALPPGQSPETAGVGLQRRMAEAAEMGSFDALEAGLSEARERVRAAFAALIDRPAGRT